VDPSVLRQILDFTGMTLSGGAVFTLVALLFPSIRGAVADRLRHRGLRDADAVVMAAQLQALRGEVNALRTELAERDRLGPANPPAGRIEGPRR
jgi:hypothetical protein